MNAVTRRKRRVPNAERRETSIRQVLDAALELFVIQGFDGTSVDQIARRAGLTKGALYFYFEDKLSLLDALLVRTEQELFEPIFSAVRSRESSPTTRLMHLTNEFSRVGAEHKAIVLLHVVISLEMHGRGNRIESRLAETYGRLREEIAAVIADGQSTGEFDAGFDPEYMASTVVAMIDGLLLEWHRNGHKLDGRKLAQSARQMILNGVGAITAGDLP